MLEGLEGFYKDSFDVEDCLSIDDFIVLLQNLKKKKHIKGSTKIAIGFHDSLISLSDESIDDETDEDGNPLVCIDLSFLCSFCDKPDNSNITIVNGIKPLLN
jgi:hypothetical protein